MTKYKNIGYYSIYLVLAVLLAFFLYIKSPHLIVYYFLPPKDWTIQEAVLFSPMSNYNPKKELFYSILISFELILIFTFILNSKTRISRIYLLVGLGFGLAYVLQVIFEIVNLSIKLQRDIFSNLLKDNPTYMLAFILTLVLIFIEVKHYRTTPA